MQNNVISSEASDSPLSLSKRPPKMVVPSPFPPWLGRDLPKVTSFASSPSRYRRWSTHSFDVQHQVVPPPKSLHHSLRRCGVVGDARYYPWGPCNSVMEQIKLYILYNWGANLTVCLEVRLQQLLSSENHWLQAMSVEISLTIQCVLLTLACPYCLQNLTRILRDTGILPQVYIAHNLHVSMAGKWDMST